MRAFVLLALVAAATAAPQFNNYNNYNQGGGGGVRTVVTKTTKQYVEQQPAVVTVERKVAPAVTSQYVESAQAAQYSSVDARKPYVPIAITSYERSIEPSGDYHYSFGAENGINLQESAKLKTIRDEKNEEHHVPSVEGSYSYVGDDGQTYTVNYVADEFGYRATGAHIPQIPDEIKKAIETLPPLPKEPEPQQKQFSQQQYNEQQQYSQQQFNTQSVYSQPQLSVPKPSAYRQKF